MMLLTTQVAISSGWQLLAQTTFEQAHLIYFSKDSGIENEFVFVMKDRLTQKCRPGKGNFG
jgi:hypothetical protein